LLRSVTITLAGSTATATAASSISIRTFAVLVFEQQRSVCLDIYETNFENKNKQCYYGYFNLSIHNMQFLKTSGTHCVESATAARWTPAAALH
jgi:hypothetical protein